MDKQLKILSLLAISAFSFSPIFAQWEPDVRLTYDDSTSSTTWNSAWSVAINNDTVHIVWTDYRDGNFEVYYKRSIDGGTSWELDTRLTNDPGDSYTSCVVVSGNNVHVVWQDLRDGNGEIYYKRSTDGGTTWSPDTRLTDTPYASSFPAMAVVGDKIHIVWLDDVWNNRGVYYQFSTDNGTTWSPDARLSENDSMQVWNPSIAVSGGYVHIVWDDIRDLGIGNDEIYYKRSTDDGLTWEPDIRLTNEPAKSWYPCIACSENNVYVVWEEWRDANREIYYKRSTDAGTNWGPDTRLTNNPYNSFAPSIAVSGGNLHIVWIYEEAGQYEIYYKRSADGGTTWGPDTRLTNNPAGSYGSCVAVSGSRVHVVWYDERDGNSEIYYKRNPTGNLIEEISILNQLNKYLGTNTFFTNSIILRFKESSNAPTRIALYNIYGAIVFERILCSTPSFLFLEDERIDALPSSIYFLSISQQGEKNRVVKMIKP